MECGCPEILRDFAECGCPEIFPQQSRHDNVKSCGWSMHQPHIESHAAQSARHSGSKARIAQKPVRYGAESCENLMEPAIRMH
jgi:hypothetical protein